MPFYPKDKAAPRAPINPKPTAQKWRGSATFYMVTDDRLVA
jgi:hypothetical protein